MGMFPDIPSFLSDFFAGLVGTGVLAAWALFARRLGRRVGDQVRRLGWPLLASVFFGASLVSAIIRGGTVSIIVLAILVGITASIMLLRFGPERFHLSAPARVQPVVGFVRIYPWRVLIVIFFSTTITLLALNLGSSLGADEEERERIVFVVSLDDQELIVFRDVLDELEPELGAEIFLMNLDSNRQVSRLDNIVTAGDMKWDLIAVDNNVLGMLAAKELVEELPRDEYTKLVPSSLMLSLRSLLTFEGTLHFVPFRPNVKIAYYNKQAFAQYGLKPPRNWEELLEVARVFKEKEGVGRVAIQGYPGPPTAVTVFEFVMAAGGDALTLDDDGARDAFEFLQRLEPYLAPEYAEARTIS
jgi:hypothetical protein